MGSLGTLITSHATPRFPNVVMPWEAKGKQMGCVSTRMKHSAPRAPYRISPLVQPTSEQPLDCSYHRRRPHPYLQGAEDTLAPGGWTSPRS